MEVTVKPELLKWARERASLKPAELALKVGKANSPAPIEEWEQTGSLPLKKLEQIAAITHTPFAMLFLPEPPEERLPIQDFRLGVNAEPRRPSLNLLETIYACQFRQAWMRERLMNEGEKPLDFVASASTNDDPIHLAHTIIDRLKIGTDHRSANRNIEAATLWMMSQLEEGGILVQRNGIVGNQTNRTLDPEEFKGFALSDAFAPLIFINGKDWHASQMFTLAHECVHLWLGESALPDGDWFGEATNPVEQFCNRVAAEILMPIEEMKKVWRKQDSPRENAQRLRPHFHVSTLALIIRASSAGIITREEYDSARSAEEKAFSTLASKPDGGGGNFYNAVGVRLGKRFIREVLISTLEGTTLYTEAFDLLGTKKTEVFNGMVKKFL